MKNTTFLSLSIIILNSISVAQNYTEISDGGWISGMNISRPVFIDLDNDNSLDMIVATWDGTIHHFEQDTPGSITFTLISETFNDILVPGFAALCVRDIDNDDLLDLIIGEADGTLYHYEQDDSGSYSFTLISESFSEIDIGRRSAPCLTNLDNNSLLDLIVGESSLNLNYYEQDEMGGTIFTLKTDQFDGINLAGGSRPVFTDINNDGLEDLIVGNINGGVRYFQRNKDTAIEPDHVNFHTFKIFPNYPNPFNPVTTIKYSLPRALNVHISIYNMLGQIVKVLDNNFQYAGLHKVQWDDTDKHGRSVTSGIYIFHIQAGEFSRSLKLLLIK